MKRASGSAGYEAAPVGSYVASASFLVWCSEPTLYGYAIWGSPDEAEIRRLCALLDVELRPAAVPHASFVDLRRLEGVDPRAFATFAHHVRSRTPAYRTWVTRQARVRPSGLAGAVVAGFGEVVPPPHPVLLHEDPGEALAWLCGVERPDLAEELEALIAAAMGALPVVQHLRRVLVPPLAGVTLRSAARALGVSERTLQRRLRGEGSTFQAEFAAAQLRAAQELLRATDLKLEVIAREVGCGSLATFSALFRRRAGLPPSEWRRRARQGEAASGAE